MGAWLSVSVDPTADKNRSRYGDSATEPLSYTEDMFTEPLSYTEDSVTFTEPLSRYGDNVTFTEPLSHYGDSVTFTEPLSYTEDMFSFTEPLSYTEDSVTNLITRTQLKCTLTQEQLQVASLCLNTKAQAFTTIYTK
ncbi:hypothetical protein LXL04_028172 [Taraxacum kok-saghyz]